jgi:hypothetical protein
MLIIAFVFLGLSAFIATGNIVGCVQAVRRQCRGDQRGYSSIPFLSFFFATLAYWVGQPTIKVWGFLPCALDPGTWMILFLPFLFLSKSSK